jgi:hypothetical protein
MWVLNNASDRATTARSSSDAGNCRGSPLPLTRISNAERAARRVSRLERREYRAVVGVIHR